MRFAVPQTVTTPTQLAEVAEFYAGVDEFVFDLETVGKRRGNPKVNKVTWIGLCHGARVDVIPMGHPNGELVTPEHSERVPWWDENDLGKRGKPRKKWRSIRIPAVFTEAPEQLWPADVWSALEPAFFGDATKIGHGVKFDILSLAKYFDGEPPAPPYGDSMILTRIFDTTKRYGLKDITKLRFDHDYDQENIAKPDKYGENGIETHPFSKAARYTVLDVRYTWIHYQWLKKQLIDRGDENLIRLEMDVLETLIPGAVMGMKLDMEALHKLSLQLGEEYREIEKRIFSVSGKVWDLNSTPQKQEFVYKIRGHEPFAFTATSCKDHTPDNHHDGCSPSTAAGVLEVFAAKDDAVADLLEYATIQKLRGTYTGAVKPDGTYELNKQKLPVKGMLDHEVNGRVSTDLWQYGADTNRFSSRNPNLQNVPARSDDPRAKALRTMFVADDGNLLVVADYGQIEYRVLAFLSKDPTLLKAFAEGWDPHAAVMAMILEKHVEDVTPQERDQGKGVNFATVYGAGIAKIATMAGVAPTRAKWIKNSYEERFPAVTRYKKDVVARARNRRPQPYVRTILGHRRPIPGLWSSDDGKRFSAERQAVNTEVQGSAADIIKVAMVKLHRVLPEHSTMLLQVHDELIVQTPEEHAEEVRELVQNTMESVKLLGDVKLEAEANIGATWADAK